MKSISSTDTIETQSLETLQTKISQLKGALVDVANHRNELLSVQSDLRQGIQAKRSKLHQIVRQCAGQLKHTRSQQTAQNSHLLEAVRKSLDRKTSREYFEQKSGQITPNQRQQLNNDVLNGQNSFPQSHTMTEANEAELNDSGILNRSIGSIQSNGSSNRCKKLTNQQLNDFQANRPIIVGANSPSTTRMHLKNQFSFQQQDDAASSARGLFKSPSSKTQFSARPNLDTEFSLSPLNRLNIDTLWDHASSQIKRVQQPMKRAAGREAQQNKTYLK